jgi:hypothetical protein
MIKTYASFVILSKVFQLPHAPADIGKLKREKEMDFAPVK